MFTFCSRGIGAIKSRGGEGQWGCAGTIYMHSDSGGYFRLVNHNSKSRLTLRPEW